jgi:riboflavin kinase
MVKKKNNPKIKYQSPELIESNLLYEQLLDHKEWFFLYWIARYSNLEHRTINTPDLVKRLKISQQTISRRIIELEQRGFINRIFNRNGGELNLTQKGYEELKKMQNNLKAILERQDVFQGQIASGMGEGAYYVKLDPYYKQFKIKLGYSPYYGTLNLALNPEDHNNYLQELHNKQVHEIKGFSDGDRTYGNVYFYMAELWPKNHPEKTVPCAILKIQRTSHKPNIIEIIAQDFLREKFNLTDKDYVEFRVK